MKGSKGITLIALIITIIVMLILVGVSVTVALQGGLFTTAEDAKQRTQNAVDRELAIDAASGLYGGKTFDQWAAGTGNEQPQAQTYTIEWNLTDIEGVNELPETIAADEISVQLSATSGYLPHRFNVDGAHYRFANGTLNIYDPYDNVTVTASALNYEEICFNVDTTSYYAKSGETWAQFVESDNNAGIFWISGGYITYVGGFMKIFDGDDIVLSTDTIIDGHNYVYKEYNPD